MIDWTKLLDRITLITGNGKNVGKTTFLGFLLSVLHEYGPILVASIGVDGEKHDEISGALKPSVMVNAGDFVITTSSALAQSLGSFKILEVLPQQIVLGCIVVAEVQRGGAVELIGPATNQQLMDIITDCKKRYAISTVLIDGAVNRMTQVGAVQNAGFIEIVRMDEQNYIKALRQLKKLSFFSERPLYAGPSHEGTALIDGALTENKLTDLPDKIAELVVQDFTRVFIDGPQLYRLPLSFVHKPELHAVIINPRGLAPAKIWRDLGVDFMQNRAMISPFWLADTGERGDNS